MQGDLLQVDFKDADIVFAANVTWDENLMSGMVEKLKEIKDGSRFISLKKLQEIPPFLEISKTVMTKMSWGAHRIFYYTKI